MKKRVFGGYTILVSGISAPEGTLYVEAHNASDAVLVEGGGTLSVTFGENLTPKIYLRQNGEGSGNEAGETARAKGERGRGRQDDRRQKSGTASYPWSRRGGRRQAKMPKLGEEWSHLPKYGYRLLDENDQCRYYNTTVHLDVGSH